MCGIAGFIRATRAPATHPATIRRMLGAIRHRGPDELGFAVDDAAAIGTARLSVIDLASGQQPQTDATGRYWLAYNGELYNYIELRDELKTAGHDFRTQSDTEVILQAFVAWGAAGFSRLNGGFAFAIFDRHTGDLFLVRDRYGERPLYYTVQNGEWIFASELKCFHAHGGVPFAFDSAQLHSMLTIWTPLPEQTGYENMSQVPPAGFVQISGDSGTAIVREYAPLRLDAETFAGTEAEATARVRELLRDSVRIRLRSDVEVGAYLSGGLDSSITTALGTQISPHRVRTFSIGFENPDFDESGMQRRVSEHLGTAHTCLSISDADIVANFPAAIRHGEVPVFRTAFVPMFLLSQIVRDAGLKVVLTGEGADESFLGYNIFKETLLRLRFRAGLPEAEKLDRMARLYPYIAHFRDNAGTLLGMYERFAEEQIPGLFSHEIRISNGRFSSRLLAKPAGDGVAALHAWIARHRAAFDPLPPVRRAQWLEFATLLPGYLLSTQGDRMGFAHGVESRLPFLDFRVVEFAASLPVEWMLRDETNEKFILKQAFAADLPAEVIDRPKQPYRAPDAAAFFAGTGADYLDAVLAPTELAKLEFLDAKFAANLVAKLRRTPGPQISQRENQAFIFLLSLALLHREFIAARDPAEFPEATDAVCRHDCRTAASG